MCTLVQFLPLPKMSKKKTKHVHQLLVKGSMNSLSSNFLQGVNIMEKHVPPWKNGKNLLYFLYIPQKYIAVKHLKTWNPPNIFSPTTPPPTGVTVWARIRGIRGRTFCAGVPGP